MKKNLFILAIIAAPFLMSAQDKSTSIIAPAPSSSTSDDGFGIKFSGFVKSDFFYDTRQVVAVREGHFLLYPTNENLDPSGHDINDHPSFNSLSIQSRLRGMITGPEAFGAKTSGVIEADFFGNAGDENGFRLRHAFVKLQWEKLEILAGQFWNPMFVGSCNPETVSFNTGSPFQPFARNPQLRLTYNLGNLKIIAAALTQRDFASPGGSIDLRNTGIPDAHLQLHFGTDVITAGLGGEYKILTPRIVTGTGYKTNRSVASMAGLAFVKLSTDILTVKAEGVYGQNLFDVMMLGGYAVHNISNFAKDYRDYTTLDVVSGWIEISTNPEKVSLGKGNLEVGVFGGYTKNMGSLRTIQNWSGIGGSPLFFSRGANIDYVYRAAPRIKYISGKTVVALECEYTVAGYGDSVNQYFEVQNVKEQANIRGLLSFIYNF